MQRHGTEIPTRAEFAILRLVEALGTVSPREVVPLTRSEPGAVRQHMFRMARAGLLTRVGTAYGATHSTRCLVDLMLGEYE